MQVSLPVSEAADRLSQLVDLAVVSGRALADLPARLDFRPRWLIGNHGAEIDTGLPPAVPPVEVPHWPPNGDEQLEACCAAWAAALRQEMQAGWPPGVVLEDKKLSLTIHYRQARHLPGIERVLLAAVGRLRPIPRIVPGQFAFNLLGDGAPDKWAAIDRLVSFGRYDGALFIGDEETDERVFRQAPEHWVTIRVGEEAQSAARFALASQFRMTGLLIELLQIWQERVTP